MPDSRDALLDRYLAGDLSRSEQRALAQAALDDPELFDLITAVTAVRAAVVLHDAPLDPFAGSQRDSEDVHHHAAPPSTPGEQWGSRTVPRRMSWRLTVGVGVAAAVVLTFVMVPRQPERPDLGAPAADRSPPGLPAGGARQPRLLAPHLGEPAVSRSRDGAPPGAAQASRAPAQEGQITALAGGVATIDLGSLDGLSERMELPVVRGAPAAVVVGHLTVTSTSLERERGRAVVAGTVRVGDRVRVAPSVYLSALSAQVAASIAGDDLRAARSLAERAVTMVESADLPADSRRAALAQLGAVEYRVQAFAEAERSYRLAQASLDTAPPASAPERARILNELGAVLIAQGDYPEARDVLAAAQSAAGGVGSVAAHVANNLAALAALRGDRAEATSLYETALGEVDRSQAPSQADRLVIEQNLAALGRQE